MGLVDSIRAIRFSRFSHGNIAIAMVVMTGLVVRWPFHRMGPFDDAAIKNRKNFAQNMICVRRSPEFDGMPTFYWMQPYTQPYEFQIEFHNVWSISADQYFRLHFVSMESHLDRPPVIYRWMNVIVKYVFYSREGNALVIMHKLFRCKHYYILLFGLAVVHTHSKGAMHAAHNTHSQWTHNAIYNVTVFQNKSVLVYSVSVVPISVLKRTPIFSQWRHWEHHRHQHHHATARRRTQLLLEMCGTDKGIIYVHNYYFLSRSSRFAYFYLIFINTKQFETSVGRYITIPARCCHLTIM